MSSAALKKRMSPFDSFTPIIPATKAPLFSLHRINLRLGISFARFCSLFTLSSVDPSSMTMTSSGGDDCSKVERIDFSTKFP